jgi:hypothetical protein
MRRRGELVERSFAHILNRGGMRRAWLCGRENVRKRYLIHVAGFNLGVLMRALHGTGTPKEAAEGAYVLIFVVQTEAAMVLALVALIDGECTAIVIIAVAPIAPSNRHFVNGLLSLAYAFCTGCEVI